MTQSQDRVVKSSVGDIAWSIENIALAILLVLIWSLGSIVLLIVRPLEVLIFSWFIWTGICTNFLMGGVAYQVTNELENKAPRTLKQKLNKTWSFIRIHWVSLAFASWIVNIAIFVVWYVLVSIIRAITSFPAIGSFLGSLLIIPVLICLLAIFALLINSYLLPCIVGVEKSGLIPSINFLVNAATTNPLQLLVKFSELIKSIVPTALLTGIITIIATYRSILICKSSQISQATQTIEYGISSLVTSEYGISPLVTFLATLETLGNFDFFVLGLIFFAWVAYMLVFVSSGFTMLYYNVSERKHSNSYISE